LGVFFSVLDFRKKKKKVYMMIWL